jgi:FkbM family methyltransferase
MTGRAKHPAWDTRTEWFGRYELDRRLLSYVAFDGGVFVEAGANDGILESNTLVLERDLGWGGLLVEPIPDLAARCRRNRPRATIADVALVAPDDAGALIKMTYGGLGSMAQGALSDADSESLWPSLAAESEAAGLPYQVEVEGRGLSEVLDEFDIADIDLLSLDVEGFEPRVLAGLDLARHRPRYVVVETWAWTAAAIASALEPMYAPVAVLGYLHTEEAANLNALGVRVGAMWEVLYQLSADAGGSHAAPPKPARPV